MKNIKYLSLMMALLSVLTLSFTSCGDDDDEITNIASSTITLHEVNIEGSKICVKADIVCPSKVEYIRIEIYSADGQTRKFTQDFYSSIYTGALNIPEFHEHLLDIDTYDPAIVEGDLLKFTVVDMNGRTTTVQKNLTEENDED